MFGMCSFIEDIADTQQLGSDFIKGQWLWRCFFPLTGFQPLPGTLNREFFFIQQCFDFKNQFNIVSAVEPLAGGGTLWVDTWKFGLPESQNGRWHPGNFTDLTNFKIELVREI